MFCIGGKFPRNLKGYKNATWVYAVRIGRYITCSKDIRTDFELRRHIQKTQEHWRTSVGKRIEQPL